MNAPSHMELLKDCEISSYYCQYIYTTILSRITNFRFREGWEPLYMHGTMITLMMGRPKNEISSILCRSRFGRQHLAMAFDNQRSLSQWVMPLKECGFRASNCRNPQNRMGVIMDRGQTVVSLHLLEEEDHVPHVLHEPISPVRLYPDKLMVRFIAVPGMPTTCRCGTSGNNTTDTLCPVKGAWCAVGAGQGVHQVTESWV